ncbi:PD-(D/E)XK nuclease family protein [Reichenbachiella sp. MSK19-1]|uniref:PDDEXK-like family protein n=1 Tax=Reichenbachiella sp. MSK19-1 TaxID=1897631 RepID=UPI000E6B9762|nr:PD-(D/E)XK nuclease family protein [Reichenbachiella sp. MSK19-1]RJE74866.1 hypothetical protein BGP76_17215 [Reichenbachiella sp. MSK19-1]
MEKREIESNYAQLLKDDVFDQLSLEMGQPNFFRILGIEHRENRHSNFLAWLLNPNESHGLKDEFLRRVLQDILIDERATDISIIEVGNLDFKKVEIRREWNHIDLLIVTEKIVVCIENKIWSGEHSDQLKRYKNDVERNFKGYKLSYVFLTPSGNESSEKEHYINYSYGQILIILNKILEGKGNSINSSTRTYLIDYSKTLSQHIMNDDSTNILAKQLYKNHKELFDFVWQNKPDAWDDFAQILQKKVNDQGWKLGSKNKGWVRFTTHKIDHLILRYKTANGWPDKEAFLFEFDFYQGKYLSFKAMISPGTDRLDYNERLVEILNEIEGAEKSQGEKWKAILYFNQPWELVRIMEEWDDTDKYDKKIDAFITEIQPLIKKIEDQFLKYEEELKALKVSEEE